MSPKALARASLVTLSLMLLPGGLAAQETSPQVSQCRALLTQQWQDLSNGNYAAANKSLNRARQDGCLRQPTASELCDIPADQEAIHDAKGNANLANMARNQQRLFGCELP